ncbi:hypothetical protein SAMN05216371_7116 [Streptomyces sp. TLI_053]|uniref:hypothetical protein n=1 Tax=Streptomyces sp. TLI_053 TaxID=1855352 RepID=UPI00087CB5B1|nr:hypothetical protein [Streptomyces sp. TLI_053]SDT82331.1 hypothetical protein SAMN05216371_7116 [Streptomyces sp. TLI_053]
MGGRKRYGRSFAWAGAIAALTLGVAACGSDGGGAGSAIQAKVVLSEPDQVRDALPSETSLPAGWKRSSGAKPPQAVTQADASATCRKKLKADCLGLQLGGNVRYKSVSSTANDIRLTLLTFDRAENAGPVFEALVASFAEDEGAARKVNVKTGAEQSQAFEKDVDKDGDSGEAATEVLAGTMVMRIGAVVSLIELDEDERDHRTLKQFADLQAERVKRVQRGQPAEG